MAFTQNDLERALTAKARPAKGKQVEHPGEGGLVLIVLPAGPGRWRYQYRPKPVAGAEPDRTRRKVTLGDTGSVSLAEAKQRAAALRLRVQNGEDPARDAVKAAEDAQRQAALAAAARRTCRDLLEDYKAVIASRGRTEKHVYEETAQVRLGLSSVALDARTGTTLMDAAPTEIGFGHVEKIMAACPMGSRALRFGALDRFFRWAVRSIPGATAPTAAFDRHEKPTMPPRRQRVLSAPEIAAVWRAAGTMPQPVLSDLVKFLISTPCREGEAVVMTWADLDLPGRTWTMPDSKNGLPHRFPLNDRATEVLAARQKAADAAAPKDLVFAAPETGEVFGSWSRLKRSLDMRLVPHERKQNRVTLVTDEPVIGWRFHDLRRTAATVMGEQFDAGLVDLMLNHKASRTRGGIVGIYNLSERWRDRQAALLAWDRWIGAALGEAQDATGADGPRGAAQAATRAAA